MSTKSKNAKSEPQARAVTNIRVGGVQIPIWKNEGKDGTYFKAGEPKLSYKANDGTWKESTSYGGRDLFNLIKAASLADLELIKLNGAVKTDKPSGHASDLEE